MELVALLPCIVLLGALICQAALAGQAVWAAGSAARAGARAHVVGADPEKAAGKVLPSYLERGLRVTASDEDGVRVRIRVPAVVGARSLGTVSARARLEPQQ